MCLGMLTHLIIYRYLINYELEYLKLCSIMLFYLYLAGFFPEKLK